MENVKIEHTSSQLRWRLCFHEQGSAFMNFVVHSIMHCSPGQPNIMAIFAYGCWISPIRCSRITETREVKHKLEISIQNIKLEFSFSFIIGFFVRLFIT